MALGKSIHLVDVPSGEVEDRRHLTEFWMVEPEVAYAELNDIMELAENFISFIVQRCLERPFRPELETIGREYFEAGKNCSSVSASQL